METSLLMPCDEQDTNHISSLLTQNDFAQSNAVFDDSNSFISAFVLPEGIVWPSLGFYASAQDSACGRRVLFVRGARHAVGTVHATVELLRNGKNAAWIGLPGIGKFSALSLLLLQLLQNAGEVGWYDIVVVRAGHMLQCFSCDQATGDVTVYEALCNTFTGVKNFCEDINDAFPQKCKPTTLTAKGIPSFVLLLDMKESEVNPQFAIPFFTSWSTSKADET